MSILGISYFQGILYFSNPSNWGQDSVKHRKIVELSLFKITFSLIFHIKNENGTSRK